MKTTTKIIAAGLIAASVMTLGLTSVSANEADLDAPLSFAEAKTITINNLKLDLEYAEDEDAKTQIESSIKALSATKTEEDFYKTLDVEEEKIYNLYIYDEDGKVTETEVKIDGDLGDLDFDKFDAESFEEEKALVIKDLQAEGAKSDVIEAVKNAKTDEEIDAVFIKMLDADMK